MIIGMSPFHSDDQKAMFAIIKFEPVRFPRSIKISDDAKNLITEVQAYLNQ